MKKLFLLSLMVALPLVAQDDAPVLPDVSQETPDSAVLPAARRNDAPRQRMQNGPRRAGQERPQQRTGDDRTLRRSAMLIKKFDKDNDGKLDEQELEEMLNAIRNDASRPQHGGRERAQQTSREDLIKQFDKDQDGKLSEEEQAEMQKALQERRKNNAGRSGDEPRKGQRPEPRHRRAPQE